MLGPVFPDHGSRTRASSLLPLPQGADMAKSILISLAVLTLATSTALAATETDKTPKSTKTTHHRHAAKPSAAGPAAAAPVAATPVAAAPASPAPVVGAFPRFLGAGSAADQEMYIKNQQDSGLATGQ